MTKTALWEGRFQPIHKGHLAYIELLLTKSETLWLYVVENEVSTSIPNFKSPVPEFTAEVDTHHISEKNPLPFWLRYQIVHETIRYEFGGNAPIHLWGGRRLDLDWPFFKKALPKDRVFLTPSRDRFEDSKARAWATLGEKVVRIDVDHLPKISATQVREAIRNKQDLSDLLSKKTLEILNDYQMLDRI